MSDTFTDEQIEKHADVVRIVNTHCPTEEGWYGAAHPVGWDDIVLRTHLLLLARYPHYNVYQVKEKFGELRYYTDCNYNAVRDIIQRAEDEAKVTCQICSGMGELRTEHKIGVFCDEHAGVDSSGYTSSRNIDI